MFPIRRQSTVLNAKAGNPHPGQGMQALQLGNPAAIRLSNSQEVPIDANTQFR